MIHFGDYYSLIKTGFATLFKSSQRRSRGVKKYAGSAVDICKGIVNDCWNGRYFNTSTGHFNYFWSRDFGWCCEALHHQGFERKVRLTVEFALKVFEKHGAFTTMINPDNVAIDAPYHSVDALPWMVRALKITGHKRLISKYQSFIEREARKLVKQAVNQNTGLVKKGYYASIKDYAVRNSSTYDNVMMAMLKWDLNALGFKNPLNEWDIKAGIVKNLWTGKYFMNDLDDKRVTSDANIFPFTTGVFDDSFMLEQSVKSVIRAKLDRPLPVRYQLGEVKQPIGFYRLVPNYQGTTVWTHMGPLFIKLVQQVKPKKAAVYKRKYKRIIEKYGNYLEVLNDDLSPFQSPFYMSDEGMLWAVNYLDLES